MSALCVTWTTACDLEITLQLSTQVHCLCSLVGKALKPSLKKLKVTLSSLELTSQFKGAPMVFAKGGEGMRH